MIYNALVLPYLSYCSLVWACNSNNKLYPVIILQKEHFEISQIPHRVHIRPLFKQLGLLKFTDICCLRTALFTFKFQHHKLPVTFYNYFTKVSSLHHYSTGSSTRSVLRVALMSHFNKTKSMR